MPQEKERVRPVPGEPRGRAGEPEQDPNRGAESTERPLLPQGGVVAAGLRRRQFQHRKRLQNKSCFDRLCFSAHSSPARPGQNPELLFLSRCLCMWRPKCPTHSACGSVRGEKSASVGGGAQVLPEDAPLQHRVSPGSSRVRRTNPGRSTSSCNHLRGHLRSGFGSLKHSSKFPPV